MQLLALILLGVLGVLLIMEILRHHRNKVRAGAPLLVICGFGVFSEASTGTTRTLALAAAALGYAGLALFRGLRNSAPSHQPRPNVSLVLFALLLAWCAFVDVVWGMQPSKYLFAYFLLAIAFAGTVILWQSRSVRPQSICCVALLVLVGSVLLGMTSGQRWRECDQFKCGMFGALYRGAFPSENYLALITVVIGLSVLRFTTGRLRLLGAIFCLAVIVATGSRTALLVGLACAAIGAASSATGGRASKMQRRLDAVDWLGPLLVASGIAAIGISLAKSATSQDFSNRGEVWIRTLAALQGHEFHGRGLSTYGVLQETGQLSEHFPHAEYLLLLFAGGYVAIVLFVLWAASLMAMLYRSGNLVSTAPILAFLFYGLTEVTWNPVTLDSLTWMPIVLTLMIAGAYDDQRREAPALVTAAL